MTTNVVDQGAASPPQDPRSPRRAGTRTGRYGLLALLAAVIVTVAAVSAWNRWTGRVLDSVTVAWQGEPRCAGARLLRDGHTIEAVRGMSCVVTLAVHNGSNRTVHLDRAIEPFLGRDGGPVIKAAELGRQRLAHPGDLGVDAVLPLDHDLRAGETWRFRVGIVWRPDGCTDGGTMFIHEWPEVRLDFHGRHATAHGDHTLTIHRHRQNPGCRMG
jgi:hypothetical protein